MIHFGMQFSHVHLFIREEYFQFPFFMKLMKNGFELGGYGRSDCLKLKN